MRVLAVNQYYAPNESATAQLLADLCEDLCRAGDDVTVVASRVQGRQRLPRRERISGVDVIRPWSTGFGKNPISSRICDDLTYLGGAMARVVRVAKPDVVLALSSPPMLASAVSLVARGRGIPLVNWVHDVYPDVAQTMGKLPVSPPVGHVLTSMSRGAHRSARISVAVSHGMKEVLRAHGQQAEQIRVQENWADAEALCPRPTEQSAFRKQHGLQGRFVVMYSGNLGVAHDLSTPILAARQLQAVCPKALFVFVGAGSRLKEAKALAEDAANIRFLPAQPRSTLGDVLAAADLHLVSLAPGLGDLVVPSKLYGVMAVARPVAYIGPADGEVAKVLGRHDVGWCFEPGAVAGLAAMIDQAARGEHDLAGRGQRARECLVERYERRLATKAMRALLFEAAGLRVE